MIFRWQPISVEDFVAFARLLGPTILQVGNIYWIETRTCFYRPLLPWIECQPDSVRPPWLASLGGAQYPVPPEAAANSHLNLLLFDQTSGYSVSSLDKNRRRQVKLAAREFEVRPMTDVAEFKRQAYAVYLTFYARTRYRVGANRRDVTFFAKWADALFKIPHVLILGAYQRDTLRGVSLSYLVKDTVFYATFFCDDEALDHYLPDLMLHTIRESAAASPEVSRVFVGMFKNIRGLDDFYLLRGATLVRQPARLAINPLTRFILQIVVPRQYAQLLGRLPAPYAGSIGDGLSASAHPTIDGPVASQSDKSARLMPPNHSGHPPPAAS